MANAGTVNVKFAAQTAAFEAGVQKVNGLLGEVGGALNLIKGLAAGFLAWKATDFVQQTMQAIDSTAKMADRLGVTTEAMVGLQHAGDLAGVSAESVARSLEKMGANLADAERGAKPVNEALAQMGLTMADLRTLTPDEQLGRIADGMNTVAGAGQRAAIAQDIFGKGGLELQQILAGGSEALRDAREEADALGISFSRLDAFKVEQANDALTRVSTVFRGALTTAAIELSPIIEAIATKFVDSAKAAGGFGSIALSVIDHVQRGVGVLADAWNVILSGWHAGKAALSVLGIGWLEFGKTAARVILGMMNGFESVKELASAVWDNIKASFGVTAKGINVLWTQMLQYLGLGLADFLHKTAEGIRSVMPATANTIAKAAHDVTATVNGEAIKAQKALGTVQNELAATQDRIRGAWSNLEGDTNNHPLIQWMIGSQATLQATAEESAYSFVQSFSAVMGAEGSAAIADWFAQIDALSTASAENSAARVAARLETDKEQAQIHAETLVAQGDFMTDMFGKQAEKQAAWDKKTWDQKLGYASSFFGNLSSLQNTSSRKMFEIGKIAAYGQAVVSTAAGIARQFADLPIWAAIPAAAAVAAAGIAQIASISSTSFGGGGSVSSSGGSIPLVNGEPAGTQMATPGVTGNQVNRLEVSISGLSDDQMVSGAFVRQLIERINEAQEDGSTLEVSAA